MPLRIDPSLARPSPANTGQKTTSQTGTPQPPAKASKPVDMTSLFVVAIAITIMRVVLKEWVFSKKRARRRDHYRKNVLTSDLWKRKRAVVMKRDGRRCVYCGAPARQVHHERYAKRNIGREPIDWLVAVCPRCHEEQHR